MRHLTFTVEGMWLQKQIISLLLGTKRSSKKFQNKMSAKHLQFYYQITFLLGRRIIKRVGIHMKAIKDLKPALKGTFNKITTNEIVHQI